MNHQLSKVYQLLRDGRRVTKGRIGIPSRSTLERLDHIHVVVHTHWDREWWKTFEGYRSTLIDMTSSLLDILENNPDFTSFTFDGQVAPIDDYLNSFLPAERPAVEARISKLIKAGRLYIGPWYTLSDQFLVSGETTLRNLQFGMKRARELGQSLDIAYCPDQFGLIQELPKILAYEGLSKVIGERGMGRDFPAHFYWETKNGSRAEVVNLKDGYFQTHLTRNGMHALARKSKGDAALFMAGYDHAVPTAVLVDEARKAGVKLSSLPAFWKDLQRTKPTMTIHGEIREVGDKNLLPNVISNHVDQRKEMAAAERALERYAELVASFCYEKYPTQLLEEAWKNQFYVATHDSACATGIDEVTRAVRVRTRSVYDTAEGITQHGLGLLGNAMKEKGHYVLNPSNFPRDVWYKEKHVWYVAHNVPPLGWTRLQRSLHGPHVTKGNIPKLRFTDEYDAGDTYTFDPRGKVKPIQIPVTSEQFENEPFTRINVAWENLEHQHRVRICIPLPKQATTIFADTSFGHVERPCVPKMIQGRDRLDGFPAPKFIVAGGLAILVDRVAEYEYLPKTNEIAITLLRSHGALSTFNPKYRLGPAGPLLKTEDTQLLGPISWDLAVLPWDEATGKLPWKEYEQFMLPMKQFKAAGGGELPQSGSAFAEIPEGILSAVLPEGIRTFDTTPAHAIHNSNLVLSPSFQQGHPPLTQKHGKSL